MRRWLGQTFAALESSDFRVLWIGTLISFLAFFTSTVVNSVVAFELSGTNRAVGAVIFAQGVSMFLFGPIGGAVADRLPKRRVIAVGQGTTALVFAVTALLMSAHALRVPYLAAGTFVMGLCFAFIGPARQAFVVDIVPAAHRGNAMALSQVANTASRVLGPALAGVLLAWESAGAAVAYAVMAFLYLLAVGSLSLLPRSRRRDGVTTHVLADVRDGLRYVRDQPRLRLQLLFFVSVVMTGFPHVTVMPGFVENQLGLEAEAISPLMVASAIGGFLASVLVARFADSPSARTIYSWLGLGFGASLFALAAAPDYPSAVLASLVIGAANGGFQTLASAVILHETRPEYIGRVMSLTMLAFAGFGLMALPIGVLADALGERVTLMAMGAVVAACVAVFWWTLSRARERAVPASPRAAADESPR